jgi:proteic killer suppression protein
MIGSFADEHAALIYDGGRSRRYAGLERMIAKKLQALKAAIALPELAVPPGNRLEALKGDRKGQHSIRINQQFHICFRWEGKYAYEIEIVDYH